MIGTTTGRSHRSKVVRLLRWNLSHRGFRPAGSYDKRLAGTPSCATFISPLRKKGILSLRDLHRTRALAIVIRHVIDSSAHWIPPHETGIVGLQQFGARSDILHARIEPLVVVTRTEDHGHTAVEKARQVRKHSMKVRDGVAFRRCFSRSMSPYSAKCTDCVQGSQNSPR